MRRLLLIFALAVPLFAGLADAQGGDVTLAAEPGYVVAEAGQTVKLNLSIYNPTQREIALEVAARPTNATSIHVLLSPTQVRVAAGAAVRVAAAVQIPRDVPPGAQPIEFGARETNATSPNGGTGIRSTTTLDLRVSPAATPAPAHPTPSPVANAAAAPASTAVAPTPIRATPTAKAIPTPAAEVPAPTPTLDPRPARAEAAAQVPASSGASQMPTVVAVGAVAAGGAGVGALALRKRWGVTLLAPLYSRLARNSMLDQPTRQRVADLITAEPGITFGDAARRLGLGAGTLTHHARMLEEAGVVFSSPDGQTRRFFPVGGGRVAPVPSLGDRALAELATGPATLSELATRLKVSKQALHYHVKKLVASGTISSRKQGPELVLEKRAEGAEAHASA